MRFHATCNWVLDKLVHRAYTKHMTSQKYHLENSPRKILDFYPSDFTLRKISLAKEMRSYGASYRDIGNFLEVTRSYAYKITNYEIPKREETRGGESL